MRIACVDANTGEMAGYTSALAITYTLTTTTSEVWLGTQVFVVGADRVNEMAATALSLLDTKVDKYRELLKVRATNKGE